MAKEQGSDALLSEKADRGQVNDPVVEEQRRLAEEEERVSRAREARNEPGKGYPDPDEAPPGEGPDFETEVTV